jgi:hypothetical protein
VLRRIGRAEEKATVAHGLVVLPSRISATNTLEL